MKKNLIIIIVVVVLVILVGIGSFLFLSSRHNSSVYEIYNVSLNCSVPHLKLYKTNKYEVYEGETKVKEGTYNLEIEELFEGKLSSTMYYVLEDRNSKRTIKNTKALNELLYNINVKLDRCI